MQSKSFLTQLKKPNYQANNCIPAQRLLDPAVDNDGNGGGSEWGGDKSESRSNLHFQNPEQLCLQICSLTN